MNTERYVNLLEELIDNLNYENFVSEGNILLEEIVYIIKDYSDNYLKDIEHKNLITKQVDNIIRESNGIIKISFIENTLIDLIYSRNFSSQLKIFNKIKKAYKSYTSKVNLDVYYSKLLGCIEVFSLNKDKALNIKVAVNDYSKKYGILIDEGLFQGRNKEETRKDIEELFEYLKKTDGNPKELIQIITGVIQS